MHRVKRLFAPSEASSSPLFPEAGCTVLIDDQGVQCRRPNGKQEAVRWEDLTAVFIETTDTGPVEPDVYWVLIGSDGKSGCVIPQGAKGEAELLEAVQRLPGFDNSALIAAMLSAENQRFLAWKRPPAAP